MSRIHDANIEGPHLVLEVCPGDDGCACERPDLEHGGPYRYSATEDPEKQAAAAIKKFEDERAVKDNAPNVKALLVGRSSASITRAVEDAKTKIVEDR